MVMVIIFILKATWSSGCDTNDELNAPGHEESTQI